MKLSAFDTTRHKNDNNRNSVAVFSLLNLKISLADLFYGELAVENGCVHILAT